MTACAFDPKRYVTIFSYLNNLEFRHLLTSIKAEFERSRSVDNVLVYYSYGIIDDLFYVTHMCSIMVIIFLHAPKPNQA